MIPPRPLSGSLQHPDRSPVESALGSLPSLTTRSMLEGLARAHPIVIAVDQEQRIVWLSDELGVVHPSASRCIGQPIDSLLDAVEVADKPRFVDRVRAFVEELQETGRVASAHFDLGPHPTITPVEVSAFRITADDGKMLDVYMTRRIPPNAPLVAETTNVDPNSRLSFILDSTPDGVLAVDRLGFVTSANAVAARLLGCTPTQLIDKPLPQFVTESARASHFAELIARDGFVESEEIEIVRADGVAAWLSISARNHVFLRADGTRSSETFVFIRDVTDRQISRMALERKNEELENCVRSVAHDLRSPLTSLLGFTRLLSEESENALTPTGRQFLKRIEAAGRNMAQLLKGMLELSRIGTRPPTLRRVDPRFVLDQLRSELKLQLDLKRIELSTPDDPPMLVGDSTQLYQLFSNLIGNAVSHMPVTNESTEARHIDVEIEADEDAWRIAVTDDGPGIALEDQQRIFEMFQTAGRTNSRGSSRDASGEKSSGLGLAIVKKIVEFHRGRVEVESSLGHGARFIVRLPRSEPADDALASAGERSGSSAET